MIVMKATKAFGITLGLLLIASLVSCQKEAKPGEYSPKKKIQRIYYAWGSQEKEPFQHWEWNGDKLSSITHYYDYGMKDDTWIENFTYENNHITRVDNYTNSEYITYDYDGDYLKTATMFYQNAIISSWTISYDGNHINKMAGTLYGAKKGARLHLNPLSHLLPPDICSNVTKREQQMAEQCQKDDAISVVLLLTWTDDNISKIVVTGDGEYMDMQLQYDDKHCPWYGFLGDLEDYLVNFSAGHTGFTKHNVTSMIVTEDQYVDTVCFAYQYDSDKYPIFQTMYYADDIDDKTILYFEY